MRSLLVVVLLIIVTFSCREVPQKNDTNKVFSKIDKLFSNWDNSNTPGGVVGIFQNGELLFSKGYGLADLEHDIPITPSTVFYLASSGKQFTAFCVLLLEEQGRLNLDDQVQKYLPDFPTYGTEITIRHLLHHLSGIRDYATLWDIQGRSYYEHISAEETYKLIKNQNSIMFKPGEKYLYCNSGYFLLSEIVEEASGMSLKRFAEENIFKPLGMNNTLFLDDNMDLIKNRAFGYQKRSNQKDFGNLIRRFDLVGSGGVYSCINDLFLWDQNFYNNKLGRGGQEIINKMYKTGVLNDGTSTGRAGGLRNEQYKGLRKISHGGSHGGFKAELMRFPGQNFTVAILANRSDVNPTSLSHQITDMFLEDHFENLPVVKSQAQQKRTLPLTPLTDLSSITGHYMNLKTGSIRKIVVEDGIPYYWRSETSQDTIVSIGPNEFTRIQVKSSKVVLGFDKDENDQSTMTYYSNGQLRFVMHKFDPVESSISSLKKYEGSYYNPEINSLYRLSVKNDKLMLAINDKEHSELSVISDNIMLNQDIEAVFLFEEDKSGSINGFKLNAERVLDLQFRRR